MSSPFSNPASGAAASAEEYRQALLEALADRDPLETIASLPGELEQRTRGMSDAKLRTPEKSGKWSVIEVVAHLGDIDLVFGFRVRMILSHDKPPLVGFDQDAFARDLGYRDISLEDGLSLLRQLRSANLRLLRACTPAQLERVGMHSERGPESVKTMMEMLAGHDIVHLRQIDRIKRAVGL
jgi:DinB family protein